MSLSLDLSNHNKTMMQIDFMANLIMGLFSIFMPFMFDNDLILDLYLTEFTISQNDIFVVFIVFGFILIFIGIIQFIYFTFKLNIENFTLSNEDNAIANNILRDIKENNSEFNIDNELASNFSESALHVEKKDLFQNILNFPLTFVKSTAVFLFAFTVTILPIIVVYFVISWYNWSLFIILLLIFLFTYCVLFITDIPKYHVDQNHFGIAIPSIIGSDYITSEKNKIVLSDQFSLNFGDKDEATEDLKNLYLFRLKLSTRSKTQRRVDISENKIILLSQHGKLELIKQNFLKLNIVQLLVLLKLGYEYEHINLSTRSMYHELFDIVDNIS